MYHPLTRDHLYCATKITVFFDDSGNEKSSSGVAFFLNANGGKIYLVTNRHVLDAGYSDQRKAYWALKRINISGYCRDTFHPFKISIAPENLIFPNNENEDLSILNLSDIYRNGDIPDVTMINISYLARLEDYKSVDISDVVAFPVYHGETDHPVMRTGWVASDPSRDFIGHGLRNEARRIAIEGFSWGGYSGSPVFTLDRGISAGDGITYGGGFRGSKLIGVNAGHIKVADGSGAHAGLSYLIKSSVILELIAR